MSVDVIDLIIDCNQQANQANPYCNTILPASFFDREWIRRALTLYLQGGDLTEGQGEIVRIATNLLPVSQWGDL